LLIIFINHVPANELLLYTPSRFGLSDAAEMFVFLSGYAAAIAYARSFRSVGFALGSLRVFHRCGQIYAAHLALFGLMAMTCTLANGLLDTRDYITHLNIRHFFDHTEEALRDLMALRYVPNYFDILPMYLVIMLWIPGILAVARVHRSLALVLPVCVYAAMWVFGLEFMADPVGSRPWFFNPFGWQLLFFVGFSFGTGWLKCPARRHELIGLSLMIVLLSLPLSPEPGLRPTPFLMDLHAALAPWLEKTRFGPLRLLHFLALAYLASILLADRERWLARWPARAIVRMGQHSLPIFLISMVLSYVGGMVFDLIGHGIPGIVAVNLGGIGLLILCGAFIAWIKSSPWKRIDGAVPAYAPVDDVPTDLPAGILWGRRLRSTVAAGLVLVVSTGPLLLLPGRRSVEAPEPDLLSSDQGWSAAQVWLDDPATLGVPEPGPWDALDPHGSF